MRMRSGKVGVTECRRAAATFVPVALVALPLAGLLLVELLALAACGGRTAAPATSAPPVPTGPPVIAHGLTGADARASLRRFDQAFSAAAPGGRFYRLDTSGGSADYWKAAEMIETVEDYYDYTGSPAYKAEVATLCNGFVARYGADWMNKYSFKTGHRYLGHRANDDVMWMIIASARAYEITGDVRYRAMAKANFDHAWARASSSDMGGGLWWRSAHDRPQKNTTTNAPAVIAACELSRALGDKSYLTKAKTLYAWMRARLFDPRTGQVYDHLSWTTPPQVKVYPTAFTYNQGTFIGAADRLGQLTGVRSYALDARRALAYTRTHLTRRGILQSDGGIANQDTGGFKGIFARWAVRFTRDQRIVAFDPWFRRNAGAAWARRNARGLIGQDWTVPTGNGRLYSWDCSAAVAMLETLLPKGR
jgi:predicted alpha-1,6-mannanase (GH76 family)